MTEKRVTSLIIFLFSDIFLEKHWKSVVPRTICDYFFEAQRKVSLNYFILLQ